MIEAMDQAQKDEKSMFSIRRVVTCLYSFKTDLSIQKSLFCSSDAAKIEELNRHIKTALDIFKVMCPTQYQEFLDGKKTNMEEFLKGAPGKGAAGKSAAGKSAAGKKNTEEKKNK